MWIKIFQVPRERGMTKSETHPGESLFSSLNDNVMEIMETWRVNSTLHHMENHLRLPKKQK